MYRQVFSIANVSFFMYSSGMRSDKIKTNIRRRFILLSLFTAAVFPSCSLKNDIAGFLKAPRETQMTVISAKSEPEGKIRILATFYPIYIMLMNLTDNVPDTELMLLAQNAGGRLTSWEPSEDDMRLIEGCGILVANGAGLEKFLPQISERTASRTIIASKDFKISEDNPYVWVSIDGAIFQAEQTGKQLSLMNPENAELYRRNTERYVDKLSALSRQIRRDLQPFEQKSFITCHEALSYFSIEFNLHHAENLNLDYDIKTEQKNLPKLIKRAKKLSERFPGIPLFSEPNLDTYGVSILAMEAGLKIYQLDSVSDGIPEPNAYISAMLKNARVLKTAFLQS